MLGRIKGYAIVHLSEGNSPETNHHHHTMNADLELIRNYQKSTSREGKRWKVSLVFAAALGYISLDFPTVEAANAFRSTIKATTSELYTF